MRKRRAKAAPIAVGFIGVGKGLALRGAKAARIAGGWVVVVLIYQPRYVLGFGCSFFLCVRTSIATVPSPCNAGGFCTSHGVPLSFAVGFIGVGMERALRGAKAARIAGGWDRSWKRAELPKDSPIRRCPLSVPFAAPVLSFFGRFRFIPRGPIRSQCERLSHDAYASISPQRFPVSLGVSDQNVWKKSSTSGIIPVNERLGFSETRD